MRKNNINIVKNFLEFNVFLCIYIFILSQQLILIIFYKISYTIYLLYIYFIIFYYFIIIYLTLKTFIIYKNILYIKYASEI